MNRDKLLVELGSTYEMITKAIAALEYSLQKVHKLDLDSDLSLDEQEILESFTARFSRLSDLFTQKYLKTFFILIGERPHTIIDKSNILEKLKIKNAKLLLDIRDIRNDITHEYIEDTVNILINKAIEATPNLIEIIKSTNEYTNENLS